MSYKLSVKREKQKAVMMFTSLHGSPSVLMQDLFNEQSFYYELQNLSGKLTLPKPRTNYLKGS